MARYLIEVPHKAEKVACAQAIKIFMSTGSHFLSNADWGCMDGEHKAWIILNDVESKEEARSILPSAYRSQAKIMTLSKFTMEEVDEILLQHPG
jgi:hypothetical protein